LRRARRKHEAPEIVKRFLGLAIRVNCSEPLCGAALNLFSAIADRRYKRFAHLL